MTRWAFNLAAGLSLLVCIAAVVLWGRSHGHYDQVRLVFHKRLWVIESCHGQLMLATMRDWPVTEPLRVRSVSGDQPPQGLQVFTQGDEPKVPNAWWDDGSAWFCPRGSYGVAHADYPSGEPPPVGRWGILDERTTPPLPYWERAFFHGGITALSAILPAMWLLIRFIRDFRTPPLRSNRCVQCGYDLRATPHRCPECGTPAAGTVNQRRDLR